MIHTGLSYIRAIRIMVSLMFLTQKKGHGSDNDLQDDTCFSIMRRTEFCNFSSTTNRWVSAGYAYRIITKLGLPTGNSSLEGLGYSRQSNQVVENLVRTDQAKMRSVPLKKWGKAPIQPVG